MLVNTRLKLPGAGVGAACCWVWPSKLSPSNPKSPPPTLAAGAPDDEKSPKKSPLPPGAGAAEKSPKRSCAGAGAAAGEQMGRNL